MLAKNTHLIATGCVVATMNLCIQIRYQLDNLSVFLLLNSRWWWCVDKVASTSPVWQLPHDTVDSLSHDTRWDANLYIFIWLNWNGVFETSSQIYRTHHCDTDRISNYRKFSRTHRSYFRSYFYVIFVDTSTNTLALSALTLFGLFSLVPLTMRLMEINYMMCFLVRNITNCYASRSRILHHWMNFYANFNIDGLRWELSLTHQRRLTITLECLWLCAKFRFLIESNRLKMMPMANDCYQFVIAEVDEYCPLNVQRENRLDALFVCWLADTISVMSAAFLLPTKNTMKKSSKFYYFLNNIFARSQSVHQSVDDTHSHWCPNGSKTEKLIIKKRVNLCVATA